MFCKIVWNQVYFNTLYTSHEPAFRVLIWSPCMILAMSCFYIRTCVHSFSKDLFCSRLCFSCHIYPRLLSQQITTYTGQKNTDFEILMTFHVKISRAIMLLIMVAQISVVILAAILLAAGTEPRTHFQEVATPVFSQSFLVPAESPGSAEGSRQACRRCGTVFSLRGENAPRGFFSSIKRLLRRRFQRINTVY
ncbi:hypothetical protein NC652_039323 [Populus alba x Populus x berolinensis]|nr:hypothetical protein NC652_039323 [Populus alba x Populus x berolinensis]